MIHNKSQLLIAKTWLIKFQNLLVEIKSEKNLPVVLASCKYEFEAKIKMLEKEIATHKVIIDTPEEFDDFISEHEHEIDGKCQDKGAQCFNDKLDVVNEILEEYNVTLDFGEDDSRLSNEYDDIVARTWKPLTRR